MYVEGEIPNTDSKKGGGYVRKAFLNDTPNGLEFRLTGSSVERWTNKELEETFKIPDRHCCMQIQNPISIGECAYIVCEDSEIEFFKNLSDAVAMSLRWMLTGYREEVSMLLKNGI